jgi:hypothetical protein
VIARLDQAGRRRLDYPRWVRTEIVPTAFSALASLHGKQQPSEAAVTPEPISHREREWRICAFGSQPRAPLTIRIWPLDQQIGRGVIIRRVPIQANPVMKSGSFGGRDAVDEVSAAAMTSSVSTKDQTAGPVRRVTYLRAAAAPPDQRTNDFP